VVTRRGMKGCLGSVQLTEDTYFCNALFVAFLPGTPKKIKMEHTRGSYIKDDGEGESLVYKEKVKLEMRKWTIKMTVSHLVSTDISISAMSKWNDCLYQYFWMEKYFPTAWFWQLNEWTLLTTSLVSKQTVLNGMRWPLTKSSKGDLSPTRTYRNYQDFVIMCLLLHSSYSKAVYFTSMYMALYSVPFLQVIWPPVTLYERESCTSING
jgi:hypothetical protein